MGSNLTQQLTMPQMQTKWASQLNPIINNPLLNGQPIYQVSLVDGVNTINHGLGRTLLGWFIIGINADVSIYDSQATNKTPNLTLILNSTGAATISLWVF